MCLFHRKTVGDKEVTVAVTPNGYADAITEGKFVLPEQRMMKMSRFLDIIEEPGSTSGVFYVQKQNSNLTDEFQNIIADVDSNISWGSEAFSTKKVLIFFQYTSFSVFFLLFVFFRLLTGSICRSDNLFAILSSYNIPYKLVKYHFLLLLNVNLNVILFYDYAGNKCYIDINYYVCCRQGT